MVVAGFWFQSVVGSGWVGLGCFFVLFFSSSSVVESPLSLLLFKLNVVSIASGCSICVFFFFFWGGMLMIFGGCFRCGYWSYFFS